MKAFVTGSTGLLGNNLVRLLLSQGHEVKALARSAEKAKRVLGDTAAEIVIGDMTDVGGFAEALEGCDVLFHGAAYFREYYRAGDHWPVLKAINVEAPIELFKAAEVQGVKKAIFVSSSGIIGRKPDGSPGDETTEPLPVAYQNLYFKSKILAEEAIQAFLKTHSLPVVLILPGWMFGPYDAAPTDSGQLVLDFLEEKLPGVIDGGSAAVDARDVAQAMSAAVEHGQSGQRYIVAGEFQSVESIGRTLAQISSSSAPKLRIPYPIALSMAWIFETMARLLKRPTLMTVNGIRALHAAHRLSSEKAKRELGVTFRPCAETLRDEIAWFRQNGYLSEEDASQHSKDLSQSRQQTS